MRFTVQYIPLRKLRPAPSAPLTARLRAVRKVLWDCMHLMAVRKNRKGGGYTVVSGRERYEHLVKHTNKTHAPCIVDDAAPPDSGRARLRFFLRPPLPLPRDFPALDEGRLAPKSRSIVRQFLKREPRFYRLSRTQQLKVLMLALRYKKTVLAAMKTKVDEWLPP